MTRQNLPVVFLAFANDQGGGEGYLRQLRNEAEQLRDLLEQVGDVCEVVVRESASLKNILDVFQSPKYKHRIAIFHFGGHANSYQLLLESVKGKVLPANAAGLAAFLSQQRGLHLVFLNGCATGEQAHGLLDAGVQAVIATDRKIKDDVAVEFAVRFYRGLTGGDTLPDAFAAAQGAVQTDIGDDVTRAYLDEEDFGDLPPDVWPWQLYRPDPPEEIVDWNLSQLAGNPYWVLPPLPPARRLPTAPFLGLSYFREKHAHIFFGRGWQILELFKLITNDISQADESAIVNPIILLYGQSGVGKSSLLAAGLLPRLKQVAKVRYLRREDAGNNLTAALRQALGKPSPQPSPAGKGSQTTSPPLGGIEGGQESHSLSNRWLSQETDDRPLVIILDQAEEIYTRPNDKPEEEITEFLDTLDSIFGHDVDPWPQGKLVLGFRKEWLAEIRDRLAERELPYKEMFLKHLDEGGIKEAILGPTAVPSLKAQYNLEVTEKLPVVIADDLLADRGSAVAPTLQIILTKLWENATGKPKVFDRDLYDALRLEHANFLGQLLDQQLAELAHEHPTASASGLVLDLLAYHTTEVGTTQQRSREEREQAYHHLSPDTLKALVRSCTSRYLLVDPSGDVDEDDHDATRLNHDTLGPLVRARFVDSQKPGQKAYRLLQNRIPDWQNGKTGPILQEEDLAIVEDGLDGMRGRISDPEVGEETSPEERLIRASRKAQEAREKHHRIRWGAAIAAVILIAIGGVTSFFLWRQSQAALAAEEAANARILARSLVSRAEQLYPKAPLVGLRLALEAKARLKKDDEKTNIFVENKIREFIQTGQVIKLSGPVMGQYSINYSPDVSQRFFKVFYENFRQKGHYRFELRDSDDGTVVGLPSPPNYVAFLRNGDFFLASYSDNTPDELWRSEDKTKVTMLSGKTARMVSSREGHFFVIWYEENIPGELRRTEDGFIVAQLAASLNSVDFLQYESVHLFVAGYEGNVPGELRRVADGTMVTELSAPVSDVFYLGDTDRIFLVGYKNNIPGEVRRSKDGEMITRLSGSLSTIFSADRFFVVGYGDGAPGELRRNPDGMIITKLSGSVSDVFYDDAYRFFVVNYLDDTQSELRRVEDGQIVTKLSGSVKEVNFSPDGLLLKVRYPDDLYELRRTEDGKKIKLSSSVFRVNFSPDGHLFEVNYSDDIPNELRRTKNGAIVTLTGPVFEVNFSPRGHFYIVSYLDDTPSELYRIEDDHLVAKLSGHVDWAGFPQNNHSFLVNYFGGIPGELRRTDNGELIAELSGSIDRAADDDAGRFIVIDYSGNTPGELRSVDDGTLITKLSGAEFRVDFSRDETDSYFLVTYSNARTEIWKIQEKPYPLNRLNDSIGTVFAAKQQQAVTINVNHDAYIIDLNWLEAIGGYPVQRTDDELMEVACLPYGKMGRFFTIEDKTLLKGELKLLGIEESQACESRPRSSS